MTSPFSTQSLAFLRGLKRHNDREWFRARKADYEQHVRAPMLAVIERLADEFRTFAPEMVADPRVNLYRIYRDTRFSEDKSPFKTNIGAYFPARGFPKGAGAGLYFHVGPAEVLIGGGLYMPASRDLLTLREHIVADQRGFERVLSARAFKDAVGGIQGQRLTRVPRGFAKDHPAAEHLKLKQFLGLKTFPAEFAVTPRFYPELVTIFRAITPLVRFLNDGLRG